METPGAKEPVRVAVSPDGTRLAFPWLTTRCSGSPAAAVASGRQTAVCDGHRGRTYVLAFSLTAGDSPRAARTERRALWDAVNGADRHVPGTHERDPLGPSSALTTRRLMTASSDETVRQWDAATGREVEAPLRPPSGRSQPHRVQPEWRVGRVHGAGPDHPPMAGDGTWGHGDPARPHRCRDRSGGRARRAAAWLPQQRSGFWGGDGTIRVWDVDLSAVALRAARPHARPSTRWRTALTAAGSFRELGRHGASVGRGNRRAVRPSCPTPVSCRRWPTAPTGRGWRPETLPRIDTGSGTWRRAATQKSLSAGWDALVCSSVHPDGKAFGPDGG